MSTIGYNVLKFRGGVYFNKIYISLFHLAVGRMTSTIPTTPTISISTPFPKIRGLYYFTNVINETEEQELLLAIDRGFDASNQELTLDMINLVWKDIVEYDRRTQQWGAYRFNKTINGIDKQTNPKRTEIPLLVQKFIKRFQGEQMLNPTENYNQVIINEYFPGQGISAHIDDPLFGCEVASLSLQSSVVMTFTDLKTKETFDLLLEPRSLIVLSEQARWYVTHEIKKRVVDKIDGKIIQRDRRVSVTMRNY